MDTITRPNSAERFGRWLGLGWRGYVRREQRAVDWMVAQGVPAMGATALVWLAKLIILGALLYTVFWLALLLIIVIVAVWVTGHSSADDNDDFLTHSTEQPDHREGVFYHPFYHDDDPDSRFDDQ